MTEQLYDLDSTIEGRPVRRRAKIRESALPTAEPAPAGLVVDREHAAEDRRSDGC